MICFKPLNVGLALIQQYFLPSGSNILSLQCASLPCIHGFNPPHSLITFSGGIFSFAPEKYFISLGFAEKTPSTKL